MIKKILHEWAHKTPRAKNETSRATSSEETDPGEHENFRGTHASETEVGSRASVEMGYEDLHSVVISKRVFRWLQIRYWGLGYEAKLPPEFIITRHAQQRLQKRLDYPHKHQGAELTMEAWYKGKEPPDSFDQDRFKKDKKKKYAYKYYAGYVWIYGLRWNGHLGIEQKYLVTVYNWKE